jgi:hypothetical protein
MKFSGIRTVVESVTEDASHRQEAVLLPRQPLERKAIMPRHHLWKRE